MSVSSPDINSPAIALQIAFATDMDGDIAEDEVVYIEYNHALELGTPRD